MSKIGNNYGVYQQQTHYNNVQNKKEKEAAAAKTSAASETETAGKTESTSKGSITLSEKAKSLLQEMQKKYGNMEIIIAQQENHKDASRYALGNKDYILLIDPDTLEAMANDTEVQGEYEGYIDEATDKLAEMKEELKEELGEEVVEKEVKNLGVSIGKDGKMSYFADLQRSSDMQRERIEKAKEEKKEEAKEAQEAEEEEDTVSVWEKEAQRVRLSAPTIEELLNKIKNWDWSKAEPEKQATAGSIIDFTV